VTERSRVPRRQRNSHVQLLLSVAQVVVVLVLLVPMIWLFVGSLRTNLDLDNGVDHCHVLERDPTRPSMLIGARKRDHHPIVMVQAPGPAGFF
jgi:ABC-type glycerol-3-phosphate transport system permease component